MNNLFFAKKLRPASRSIFRRRHESAFAHWCRRVWADHFEPIILGACLGVALAAIFADALIRS